MLTASSSFCDPKRTSIAHHTYRSLAVLHSGRYFEVPALVQRVAVASEDRDNCQRYEQREDDTPSKRGYCFILIAFTCV